MFGMSDPTQTLLQLENYVKDGRLEMSEVMATQFTDMFLSNKKRTQSEQILLIRGLQILCDVLLIRGKTNLPLLLRKPYFVNEIDYQKTAIKALLGLIIQTLIDMRRH